MKKVKDDLEDISEVREDQSGMTESPREDNSEYNYSYKSPQKKHTSTSKDLLRPTPKGAVEDDA